MKKSLVLAASAFGLGLAAFSAGQAIDPTPSGISIRAGAVLALDDDLREVSKTWAAVGLDYTFTKQYLRNSDTYLSLDYIFNNGRGKKGSYWPLMLSQKFYMDNGAEEGNRSYLNFGLGVVFFDIESSETGGGIKAGFGHEFGPNIFGEATLFLTEARNGITGNSLGFFLGYKF